MANKRSFEDDLSQSFSQKASISQINGTIIAEEEFKAAKRFAADSERPYKMQHEHY